MYNETRVGGRMSREPFRYRIDRISSPFSKVQIIASLKKYGEAHRRSSFTEQDYNNWVDKIAHSNAIARRFGGWGKALQAAGFRAYYSKLVPRDMVDAFRNCWREQESVPSYLQLAEYLEKHNYPFRARTCQRFFGGLGRLAKLIEQADLGELPESKLYERNKPVRRRLYDAVPRRVRLAVLKRDGYRCVKCGANPKDDTSVRLEVDHIIPGSRGGPATMENLQTLCLSCNQGKKDDDD
ncbi:MAG TPA: HNH endonuclease [Terriglobia bacterium]|nr:HNH endonuclease [Terriglobia bacterium]